jgi:hypothetical protein
MSLASEYAVRQAAAASDQDTVTQSAPPTFTGPNGTLSVTPQGELRVSPGPAAGGELVLPAPAALAAAQWILDTFAEHAKPAA